MTNIIFPQAKLKLVTGDAAAKLNGDIRLLLAMTNNTIDDTIDDSIEFLGDITDLDEHDGSGYARLQLATATPTVAIDNTRDSVKLTCASDPVFASLGAGTRSVAGVLFYWNVLGDDAQSIPFIWAPYTTPRNPDGSNFTIELPAGRLIIEVMQAAVGTTPITG